LLKLLYSYNLQYASKLQINVNLRNTVKTRKLFYV